MTRTIDDMITDILRHEGGFNDHAEDRGGPTNQGVSLRYARGVGLDLDGDGDTDRDDIQLVTPEVAAELYKDDFYIRPQIDKLPVEIQPQVFDCAVNHGPPRAIMFVQRVLNLAGFGPTDVDGVIGPDTLRRAELCQSEMGPFFNNAVMHERIAFYRQIVAADPSQGKFLGGWLARARGFQCPTS